MKTDFLEYWVSFLKEVPLETIRRSDRDALHVTLKKGRLMLSTDSTIYSWDDKYMNYVWGFEKLKKDKVTFSNGLLLGMGLGAVPFILENKFDTSIPFVAVEIDPDVVRLAQKYGLPRLKIMPKVICNDATSAIFDIHDKFDLIVVDICKEDTIPEGCESEAFLTRIKDLLSDNGVMMYNRFYSTYKDHFRTDRFYKHVFKKIFPSGYLIDQNGTCLLTNDKDYFHLKQ